MNDERVFLTSEQAEAMLPNGDYIHTFRSGTGILLGADWKREKILEAIKTYKPELSGKLATSMDHGIVLFDPDALFIATKAVRLAVEQA